MPDYFKNAQKRKQQWGWWIFLLAMVVVAVFMVGQGIYPQPQPTAPVAPAVAAPPDSTVSASATDDGSFLPEYSAEDDPFSTTQAQDERPLWQIGLDVAWKFMLVIGLLYATLLGLRRLQKNKAGQSAAGTTIQVLETVGLAPGRSLHLVVVGEKTLLVGATDHQLSLLTELNPEAVPLPDDTSTDDEMAEQAAPAASFESALAAKIDEQAVTYHPQPQQPATSMGDWQTTLNSIQRKMQQIKDVVGSKNE